ncbi:Probable multidrug resistance ABC transporter ATP-binding/permease protein YheH [uncultured Ruminococcus sp.]|uniref:ABC transporter ATP-binding protein n=1 Tax=Massiliimalia timonensis TaxID=1987501 RepID=UPI0008225FF2|nr:ABC transporter ATP-binding protein [Massiliimalia timonensis]MBS7175925.1 ABC transporter ATP-binding protein [Clostridiales bacterium]SCH46296.1 Probable multidrug resistance ABC transporter ATP-binding/permease protein YheH [uncultured Ruminococcus sp.]SCI14202.1 Probable multidrug resistance ABC transporter ATP-binding/permease protein YheH [uncultured Clostridium sp.]
MAKNKSKEASAVPSTTARGQRAPKGVLRRLLRTLFEFYPVLLPITLVCILINAIVSSIPSIFMQNIIAIVDDSYKSGDWNAVAGRIVTYVLILLVMYVISLAAGAFYTQMMAIITQGSLKKMREKMFSRMQDLPVKYFDTNGHGDIMSYYTNDVDTLRQLISQSLPQILIAGVTLLTVFGIMMYYSMILGLIVVVGVICMVFAARAITNRSSKYFLRQQITIAKAEAFMEEMMTGQKVIKVFCHEEGAKADFDKVNGEIFFNARNGNRFANILMPLMGNIGNVMYVVVALVGGALLLTDVPNISISGMAFSISIVVPFLNMTKQFAGAIGQVSNQVNMVIMGLAGAHRIFALLDQEPEADEGYVTLVNAKENADGSLSECKERTNVWAWKHPHHDGTVTYTRLQGDVRFFDVDFGYTPEKMVLHNISLYAKPGQKVAFVGSTGAGKTTITNLINRFYDIEDGKIRYDGININKIKKADLRRSLGIVLQDTNLFTGTVMENIRYGNLDASDEECIAAAQLAGADDFIRRLPEGYDTMLQGNGANLSQGQRQLLAIARAAVADPPVMILDEATSSIDTRTEAIVQRGMDALMTGRTVFVIAHRLSTVQNSNAIMVLDHGRITERGTHEDLIKQKGTYYQLYTGALELD